MNRKHEIVVVGGGIAGASVAFNLASCGHDVAILEKTREPHHKVCGEFLSGETHPYLQEMDLDLDKLGAKTVSRFKLHSRSHSTEIELPIHGRGFSRYKLDSLLLKQAEAAGAQIYRGADVRDISHDKSSFRIRCLSQNFTATALFLATGKHAFNKLHDRRGKGQDFIGFKYHIKLADPVYSEVEQNVELFTYPGGYGGIAPIESQLINLCFLLEKETYKRVRSQGQNAFDYIRISNPQLFRILENVEKVSGPFAISHIPYGYIYKNSKKNNNVFILGDQNAVISSLAGDGMAIAFYTAKKSAQYYHEYGLAGIQGYHEDICKNLKRNVFLSFAVQQVMRFSLPLNVGIGISNRCPKLINWIFSGTRTPPFELSHVI